MTPDTYEGATRTLPDGGSQVFTAGRWVEARTEQGRAAMGRTALKNLEAEQNVLGSILYENAALDDVGGVLTPDTFSEPYHARLYEVVRDLVRSGRRADPTTAWEKLKADPAGKEFGGFRYLADLVDHASPLALRDHAAIIADLSQRRALVDAAHVVMQEVANPGADAQAQIAALEARLAEIADTGAADAWKAAGDIVGAAIQHARDRDGAIIYTWGLDDLDEMTGGLNAGETAIIAGRPGMMKTGVGIRVALSNAARGLGTAVFSLEMSDNPMGLRMACATAHDRLDPVYSGVPGADGNPWYISAAKGRLSPRQWERLDAARRDIAAMPLLVDTRAGLTVSAIEAATRRAHRKWRRMGVKPGPVVVDHLGLVRPEKDRKGAKHAEVADVSRGLAEMAKRLGVPVVALCQLNRGVEGRDDKRPSLSDLRQAGEIEEDARAVVMLYRPAYYLRPPLDGKTEGVAEAAQRDAAKGQLVLLVEKNSHGATGQVEAFCDPATSLVDNKRIGGAQ